MTWVGSTEVRRPCAACGAEVGPDGYCLQCGTKAVLPRDHFTERPAAWVAGICDRGPVKVANEDALALAASAGVGERAVMVVLDGVSSADDSAGASLSGARAAREVLWRSAATPAALRAATDAAQAVVAAAAEATATNPPAATFAAAVVDGARVIHAGVGDSRVYWFPDAGDPVQLTTDDSLAEALVTAGTPRPVAAASPRAHALTRWLGRDSDDPTPHVGTLETSGPGWLLVCTDGLWNYASSAASLREQIDHAVARGAEDAEAMADALWRFACAAGGHDNITVALARLGAIGDNGRQDTGDEESRGSIDG